MKKKEIKPLKEVLLEAIDKVLNENKVELTKSVEKAVKKSIKRIVKKSESIR